jgi:diamine N-acetyltransferase
MNITFKEVTKDNLYALSMLKVSSEQNNFVAPNTYSVAQSKFYPSWMPLGVYDDEVPVGFFMYGIDNTDKALWIIRMMIDEKFQGKGYGRHALEKLIERIKMNNNYSEVFLSFVPGNERAKKLYESVGFKDTGRIEEDEIVYRLQL